MNSPLSTFMSIQSLMLMFFKMVTLCGLITGCSTASNKASNLPFVSIHNQTKSNIDYKTRISKHWNNAITLSSQDEGVLLSYSTKMDNKSVPKELEHLIIYLPTCQFHLNRRLIETHMVPPVTRSKGWELPINSELIKLVDCK